MKPHLKMYSKGYRLKRLELFDVSNLDYDGNLARPDSMKAAFSKVMLFSALKIKMQRTRVSLN